MDLLPAAATFALRKVALVVAAHLRRQAGNVVSPARQNLAYNWINALLTHKGLQRRYNWMGGNTSDCTATSTRF